MVVLYLLNSCDVKLSLMCMMDSNNQEFITHTRNLFIFFMNLSNRRAVAVTVVLLGFVVKA